MFIHTRSILYIFTHSLSQTIHIQNHYKLAFFRFFVLGYRELAKLWVALLAYDDTPLSQSDCLSILKFVVLDAARGSIKIISIVIAEAGSSSVFGSATISNEFFDLQQQGMVFFTRSLTLQTARSIGSTECKHSGRNSQFLNIVGRIFGFCLWNKMKWRNFTRHWLLKCNRTLS